MVAAAPVHGHQALGLHGLGAHRAKDFGGARYVVGVARAQRAQAGHRSPGVVRAGDDAATRQTGQGARQAGLHGADNIQGAQQGGHPGGIGAQGRQQIGLGRVPPASSSQTRHRHGIAGRRARQAEVQVVLGFQHDPHPRRMLRLGAQQPRQARPRVEGVDLPAFGMAGRHGRQPFGHIRRSACVAPGDGRANGGALRVDEDLGARDAANGNRLHGVEGSAGLGGQGVGQGLQAAPPGIGVDVEWAMPPHSSTSAARKRVPPRSTARTYPLRGV
ncbi:hypothetical protein G6F35_012900 [Rhizopus arrhizus]|nr:hypothetical protein G6F35_012900 [Rhizopus arrhizus]